MKRYLSSFYSHLVTSKMLNFVSTESAVFRPDKAVTSCYKPFKHFITNIMWRWMCRCPYDHIDSVIKLSGYL